MELAQGWHGIRGNVHLRLQIKRYRRINPLILRQRVGSLVVRRSHRRIVHPAEIALDVFRSDPLLWLDNSLAKLKSRSHGPLIQDAQELGGPCVLGSPRRPQTQPKRCSARADLDRCGVAAFGAGTNSPDNGLGRRPCPLRQSAVTRCPSHAAEIAFGRGCGSPSCRPLPVAPVGESHV